MASSLEDDLCCPICLNIFCDPVVLSCSHSFCRVCVETCWSNKPLRECPICKRRISKDPPPNRALKNVCESYIKISNRAPASVCRHHQEELRLFCEDHQEALCVVCRDSEEHLDHSVCSFEEAMGQQKKRLMETLLLLKSCLQRLDKAEVELAAAEQHVQNQARLTEKLIQEQFQKLQKFLLEEEQTRIRAVREEDEQKRKNLKDKMAAMSRERAALTQTLEQIEELLQDQDQPLDVLLLLQYKSAVERVQRCPLVEEPQMGPGALMDQAKHLGNLVFRVWTNMKRLVQYSPVVLDPNTTSTDLILSKDLTTVTFEIGPTFPQNPERLQSRYWSVLGSKGLTCGTHSWDVHVSQNKYWELGVASKSDKMAGILSEIWKMRFWQGEYEAGKLTGQSIVLSISKKPQKIRVVLDLDQGQLSFSDPDSQTVFHRFTQSFSGETLFPFVFTGDNVPLRVLPQKLHVNLGQKGTLSSFR